MTSSSTVDSARPTAREVWVPRLADWVTALPDRALVFSLCAILATTVTVQLNVFHPYTVFPLWVVLVALTWRMMPEPLTPRLARKRSSATAASADGGSAAPAVPDRAAAIRSRASWIGGVAAIVLALAWIAVQRDFFSELLSVRRDPAIYTLRGIWLMNHPSPDVTLTPQLVDIAKAVPHAGLDFGAETFKITRYFQSTTVVPGLIAIAGWIGGIPLLLKADVIIGGMALLSVYAVARRMAGPIIGLLPPVVLGLCIPMVSFSRVAYTEPLSMIAVMACLLGLWQAAVTNRPAMWLLAGIGAGSVAICRIDGWIVPLGAFVGIGIWGAFATSKQMRRKILAGLGWFCLAALPVGALGATDLIFHSPDYLRILKPSWKPLAEAVPAAAVLAVLVIVLPGLPKLAGWFGKHSKVISRIAMVGIGVAILLVIARPLFYQAHHVQDTGTQVVDRARQVSEGLPIDPTRSYDEESVTWISWYLGWPTVIMACLSGVWAIRVAIRKRLAPLVLVVSVIAVNAALYLNVVSITPDQIWAMRRFLPVILPGGLLILGWGLRELYDRRAALADRFMPGRPAASRPRTMGAFVAVLAAVVVLFTGSSWNPKMFAAREGAGQYDFVQKICAHIANQKVLLVGNIPQMGYYQPTFRNICGSTVITLPASAAPTEQNQIAKVLSMWGPGPVKVVSFYSTTVPWTKSPGGPWFTDTYSMWQSVLSHRPRSTTTETTQVWLGTARADGRVDPE